MVRVSKQNDTDIYSTYIFSEIYSSRFFNNTNFEIRKKVNTSTLDDSWTGSC